MINKQNIRQWLFVTSLFLACCSGVTISVNAQSLKKIGVQLYTVRSEMEKDFEGTLRRIAALGYDEVEFAGLFDHNPKEVRSLVQRLGMQVVSSHIDPEQLEADPAKAIDETKALGAKYMVMVWIPPERRKTLKQWQNWVALMNRVGKMCSQKGIQFVYHNHDFEFEPVEGVEPYNLLLDTVDRRYVKFELDLYWLKLAGREPKPLFLKYPKGFPLCHVKDMNKTEKTIADVGDGIIDFAGTFRQSRTSGMQHYFVEHDESKAPFETIERSIRYLRGMRF